MRLDKAATIAVAKLAKSFGAWRYAESLGDFRYVTAHIQTKRHG